MTLSDTAKDALKRCLVTRGKNRGLLLARAPALFGAADKGLAYAAWMGAMLSINPYKASIGGRLFMNKEQAAVCNEVTAFFDAHPELRGVNRDRAALEKMGAW